MHKIQISKTININIEEVYNTVMNIESYSEFLPWCEKINILSRDDEKHEVLAEVIVSYMAFNESYRCLIKTHKESDDYEVRINAVDGPFKLLHGFWILKKNDELKTDVFFQIEFEFKSFIMNKASTIWLNYAKNKIISALEKKLLLIK